MCLPENTVQKRMVMYMIAVTKHVYCRALFLINDTTSTRHFEVARNSGILITIVKQLITLNWELFQNKTLVINKEVQKIAKKPVTEKNDLYHHCLTLLSADTRFFVVSEYIFVQLQRYQNTIQFGKSVYFLVIDEAGILVWRYENNVLTVQMSCGRVK